MKRLMLIVVLAILAGCATNETRQAEANANAAAANAQVAQAQAAAEESKATQALAAKASPSGADAALLVRSLKGLVGGTQTQQVVQQAPQSLFGMAWQSVLQVADLALRGYGIKSNRDVAIAQSNNATTLGISSNATMAALGSSIERAGTAGYPYVQAPASNLTYTLNGTGVLGSGTYTGPVTTTTTTTRTCNGGTGGQGTGTVAVPGGGGSATGGNC